MSMRRVYRDALATLVLDRSLDRPSNSFLEYSVRLLLSSWLRGYGLCRRAFSRSVSSSISDLESLDIAGLLAAGPIASVGNSTALYYETKPSLSLIWSHVKQHMLDISRPDSALTVNGHTGEDRANLQNTEGRAQTFLNLWQAVSWKTISRLADETLCIDHAISKFRLLLQQLKYLPKHLVFQNVTRMGKPGLRWALESLMGGNRIWSSEVSGPADIGRLFKDGFVFTSPGFLFPIKRDLRPLTTYGYYFILGGQERHKDELSKTFTFYVEPMPDPNVCWWAEEGKRRLRIQIDENKKPLAIIALGPISRLTGDMRTKPDFKNFMPVALVLVESSSRDGILGRYFCNGRLRYCEDTEQGLGSSVDVTEVPEHKQWCIS
ncbi:uncharacterized protein BDZ99DRAFT_499512 [Mytilinidion resinicola]|uniref:Uncharacterized protein n=1 Tax=Mytilinidion resinicola TaxID=574789 RepID=A0A6A6YK72_9PEZI|nr:uncharacterized protein BDZ99DRAFT_499512 [Mytilinidion resinicola]KAF2809252.1 hypothetical protein BDZ99DRAFT_499512 [Mytilinidion resinicola]